MAPHAVMGNDDHTAPLASELAKGFNFYGLINEKYRKPKKGQPPDPRELVVDLNRIDQVEKYLQREFLKPLLELKNRISQQHGPPILVYIHGIKDDNLVHASGEKVPDRADMLIGYGQSKSSPSFSASLDLVDRFIEYLQDGEAFFLTALKTDPGYRNYRGASPNNLNQLFRLKKYRDERVQSFQLEIRWTGCRDSAANISKTARALGRALTRLAGEIN